MNIKRHLLDKTATITMRHEPYIAESQTTRDYLKLILFFIRLYFLDNVGIVEQPHDLILNLLDRRAMKNFSTFRQPIRNLQVFRRTLFLSSI